MDIVERDESDRPQPKAGYERPVMTVLGTLAEMTKGIVPTSVDSVLPGSLY
jgi:hypothetical protein